MLINGSPEIIGSTNVDLSQYVTSATFATLENRVSDLEPVVGDLTSATTSLRTDLDNLISSITNNYVLVSTFNSVIGDLTAVNGVMNDLLEDSSIAETLEDIYERLTWQEIRE